MTKYLILSAIGLGIDIIAYGIHYFVTPVSTPVLSIASTVGAVFMIAGIYFYRKAKK